jgi:hypothetical protein
MQFMAVQVRRQHSPFFQPILNLKKAVKEIYAYTISLSIKMIFLLTCR